MIRGTQTYQTTLTKRNISCTEFIVNFHVRGVLKMEQMVDKWHDVITHRWMCGIVSCSFLKKKERLTIKFLCAYKLHTENEQWNDEKQEKKMICRKNVTSISKLCSVQMANEAFKLISAPFKFNIATIRTAAWHFAHYRASQRGNFHESIAQRARARIQTQMWLKKPKRINVHWILSESSIFIGGALLWLFSTYVQVLCWTHENKMKWTFLLSIYIRRKSFFPEISISVFLWMSLISNMLLLECQNIVYKDRSSSKFIFTLNHSKKKSAQ